LAGLAARHRWRLPPAPRIPWGVLAATLAGLLAVAIVQDQLGRIPGDFWKNRDDGVITLSHGRNLIDHGFIGVSPSGERVEGYSSPLEMALFALAYGVTRCGYASYTLWQTRVFSFALGVAAFACLRTARAPLWLTVVGAGASVAAMSISLAWLLWHGSGLENSITHAVYLGAVALLARLLARPDPPARWAAALVVASQVRSESAGPIGVLVALFVAAHAYRHREARVLRLSGAFVAGVALLLAARWWYFGDLVPNTAHAQDLSASLQLERLCEGQVKGALLDAAVSVFRSNLGPLSLLALPLLPAARLRPEARFVAAGASLLIVLGVGQVLLFGEARLDPPRTTTYLAVASAVLFVQAVLAMPVGWPARLGLLALLTTPQARALLRLEAPHNQCCAAASFEELRGAFERRRDQERLPRPCVANVDLGAVSFSKQFNVLDLGMLGSRVMAASRDDRQRGDFFFRVAQPDLIELHGNWKNAADYVTTDPRLRRDYEPWWPDDVPYLAPWCSDRSSPCFWARRAILAGSASAERRLIDQVAASPAVEPFERAIQACNARGDRDGCLFVGRTAYRFLPDFTGPRRGALLAAFEAVRDPAQRRFIGAWLRSGERRAFERDVQEYLDTTRKSP